VSVTEFGLEFTTERVEIAVVVDAIHGEGSCRDREMPDDRREAKWGKRRGMEMGDIVETGETQQRRDVHLSVLGKRKRKRKQTKKENKNEAIQHRDATAEIKREY
jgi:hypothetical protein